LKLNFQDVGGRRPSAASLTAGRKNSLPVSNISYLDAAPVQRQQWKTDLAFWHRVGTCHWRINLE